MTAPRFLKCFGKSRSGTAAIEFAIVAPLFFGLFLSFFEGGWLMTRAIMQDAAVSRVMREIKVDGTTTVTAGALKEAICDQALVFLDCEANTMVEMVTLKTAADTIPTARERCVHRGETSQFKPGDRSEFVFVRVCTSVTPITPFIGLAVATPDETGTSYGIVTQAAFVNEPK